jgi:hypothetical protein
LLELLVEENGDVRVAFGASRDWLGPGRVITRDAHDVVASSRVDDGIGVLRLEAARDLVGVASGTFSAPAYAWQFDPSGRHADGVPAGTRAFGFQYTEFGWPAQSDASLAKWRLLPFRPPVLLPVALIAPDNACVLLGPLDSFHEQIISVDDGLLTCGWHGDLARVPARFATELAVIAGDGMRECLTRYGDLLLTRAETRRPAPDRDELGRRVSYWTDNGSAYWYRTEPGHDTPETLRATIDDLRARDIPFGAVQLDSWWYPHEVVRPFDTEEWVVPPTGLVRWEPRDDVLPDGVGALRAALGDPPLVTHCRHLSSSSPYVDEFECWVDADRAHPVDGELYERWLEQARAWGVETFEHDWLVESFLGVRGLREAPGRARRWQESLDRAATARGMTLQWCMPTPADLLQTTTLESVTSVRTSGDHGYLIGPGELWTWFLLTNALARALGLRPYKDVFFSDPSDPAHHSEVEALLSALSSGPVGIGDALGGADRDIVLRTCRADGVIVRPDVALAATDPCFAQHPVGRSVPLVADTHTDHGAGRWHYVTTMNVSRDEQPVQTAVATPAGYVQWDWRAGVACRDDRVIDLAFLDWHLAVLAPVLPSGLAVFGDVTRYASAGRSRIASVEDRGGSVRITVLGAGERVTVTGWGDASTARTWAPARGWQPIDVATGDVWRVDIAIPSTGWIILDVRP